MFTQRVQAIGNLGADPEMVALKDGSSFARFSIAVTEKWKDKSGERQERTEWISCEAFVTAPVVEKYCKKGTKVYIEGKLKTRKYTDQNGIERYATAVNVLDVTLIGDSKKE